MLLHYKMFTPTTSMSPKAYQNEYGRLWQNDIFRSRETRIVSLHKLSIVYKLLLGI